MKLDADRLAIPTQGIDFLYQERCEVILEESAQPLAAADRRRRNGRGAVGVEIAGVDGDGDGNLYAADLRFTDGRLVETSTVARSGDVPFLAAAILRPGVVAGVTRKGIHWLRRGTGGLRPAGSTDVPLPAAVACFRHQRGSELIVVCGDGTLVRVPASSV
jgi:hypothetical protein